MSTSTRTGRKSSITSGKRSSFEKFQKLSQEWAECDRCLFSSWRNKLVWGKGRLDAGIVLIGEAPGRDEDAQGLPFVGASGEILDKALTKSSLRFKAGDEEANCLVVNALSCRPCNEQNGSNRKPATVEIRSCRERLEGLLRIARPSLVILLGNVATEAVFGLEHIPKNLSIDGVRFFKTVHPMAPTYNKDRKAEWDAFWRELQPIVARFRKRKTKLRWRLPI